MATPRWEPFREMQSLRDAMERFVQEGIVRPASNFIPGMRGGTIPVDIIERDEAYLVRAALPGVRPDQATVTLQGHVLTIRGEMSAVEAGQGQRWLLRELRTGPFSRTLSLPAEIDTNQSTARFRQGILELTLPKQVTMRPRQIQIQGSGAQPGTAQDPAQSDEQGDEMATPDTRAPSGQSRRARGATAEARRNGHTETDAVAEASRESFPASDAPSWSAGSTGGN